MASRRNPLDLYALNVGRVCHSWADLGGAIGALFALVAEMNAGPSQWVMIDHLSFRDLAAGLRVGVIAMGNDKMWAEEVISALDYATNDLRPLRNRYVHDIWRAMENGEVRRSTNAPRLHKVQSRQALVVTYSDITIEDPTVIRTFVREINTWRDWFWELYGWKDVPDRSPLGKLLAKRPQRRLLPYQPETPRPDSRGGTRLIRPRRSSPA